MTCAFSCNISALKLLYIYVKMLFERYMQVKTVSVVAFEYYYSTCFERSRLFARFQKYFKFSSEARDYSYSVILIAFIIMDDRQSYCRGLAERPCPALIVMTPAFRGPAPNLETCSTVTVYTLVSLQPSQRLTNFLKPLSLRFYRNVFAAGGRRLPSPAPAALVLQHVYIYIQNCTYFVQRIVPQLILHWLLH